MIGRFTFFSKRRTGILAACALAALLSACAGTPRRVPHPHGQEAALIPPDTTLTLSDGARIPVRIWRPPAQPRAIVLALHGFGDSRDAWEMPAPKLVAQGIAIFAPDQRGFGQAPGCGGWTSTERMVADAREEAAWLHAQYPATPLFVMGESMGGAVALRLDEEPDPTPIAGTILVAPAVWRLDDASRATLAVMDAVAPHWRFDGSDLPVRIVPSDNLAALRRLYFDPLTLHSSTLHALHGLVELMAAARAGATHARLPVLAIYGDNDQLVPPGPMARFWRALPHAVRRDEIPGGHHLLLRDRAGARATADIAAWILRPDHALPSGGDIAAAAWSAGDP